MKRVQGSSENNEATKNKKIHISTSGNKQATISTTFKIKSEAREKESKRACPNEGGRKI